MTSSSPSQDLCPAPFIVGVGRSGTTLLRMMLNAHPQLSIPPETGFLPLLSRINSNARSQNQREQFFEILTKNSTWPDAGIEEAEFRAALTKLKPFTVAEGTRTFYRLYSARQQKLRWGDKTPMHCLHLQAIQQLLPEARFIHIIRDGRDVALSVKDLWFSPAHDMAGLALNWCRSIREARRQSRDCSHYMEVFYEELVRRPEFELRRICEFLQLSYDPQMEEYFQGADVKRDEMKARYNPDGTLLTSAEERWQRHRLLAQPPQVSRVSAWKREMPSALREEFEAVGGDLLRELGYEMGAVDEKLADGESPNKKPARPGEASVTGADGKSGLNILITNHALAERGGTELYVRDLAIELLRRGHHPVAYSPRLGEVAAELRAAMVPVVDDLRNLTVTPDLIHGHHHQPTMTALWHFTKTPAVYFCHGTPWQETPVQFPRIMFYGAVDRLCRDRLQCEAGIPPEQVRVIPNFVNLRTFRPRAPLPTRPRRALIFSNYATESGYIPLVRAACKQARIQLDVIGGGVGRPCAAPQDLLGEYDLVFAKAKCALEALAVGCAVILCDMGRSGPMVRYDDLERLRQLNFGNQARDHVLSEDVIAAEISRYDAQDAMRVMEWIRTHAGLEQAVDTLENLYGEVLTEYSFHQRDTDAESRATAHYVSNTLGPRLNEYEMLGQNLRALENSKAVRWSRPLQTWLNKHRSSE